MTSMLIIETTTTMNQKNTTVTKDQNLMTEMIVGTKIKIKVEEIEKEVKPKADNPKTLPLLKTQNKRKRSKKSLNRQMILAFQ